MKYIFTLLSIFFSLNLLSQNSELLNELDLVLSNKKEYSLKKEAKLDSLKLEVEKINTLGKGWERYQILLQIADEYARYKFDSAFNYSKQAIDLAYQINNANAIAYTKSKFGHLLVSVGLHKEAIDTLNSVNTSHLKNEQLQDYYGYKVRAYYDLADYINDEYYAPSYRKMARSNVDSLLKYKQSETTKPVMTKAIRFLAEYQLDSAAYYYNYTLKNYHTTLHDEAMIHSCLGFINIEQGNTNEGRDHLIKSVIADVQTATKEAISLIVLANYFYNHNDLERAYRYILKAKEDALFFGSKQRLLQVSEVLPKIEGATLLATEKSKEKATRILWVLAVVAFVVIVLLMIVYRQLFDLQKIWAVINNQNKELKQLNTELQEVNKIKEKYIGHFFNTSSTYINKLETISKSLNTVLVSNNTQNLKTILRSISPKKERDQLFHNFDEIFLSLFPSFIEEVDKMLDADKKYTLKPGQILNTELRILAIIRLGIIENETMSQVLGVSINTIYTYKTKAQNRSSLSTELFFERLNQIKSV
ncbi:DUF6377 domain-containing protein [Saccharicrinis aurantiacus]|uniref:DUF6377 domain-containing protein n=1 Tax=Saccharicrinis aurantiacus TaxID=1849719 RepID=UPI000839199A|nr:DUF6377 domain-containing protein [Saccharicrinis aurantiacus]